LSVAGASRVDDTLVFFPAEDQIERGRIEFFATPLTPEDVGAILLLIFAGTHHLFQFWADGLDPV